jgi:hypothetical protein
MKLEEWSALDWRFTDRNPHDNRADRAAAESSRRTACKGQGQDRPCRARPADRSLVAEDRSVGGVRDPTGPEELPRVLWALAHETVVTEDGPHPLGELGAVAARCEHHRSRRPCHPRAISSGHERMPGEVRAAGRQWHARGQGFKSPQLHPRSKAFSGSDLPGFSRLGQQIGSNLFLQRRSDPPARR